MKILDDSSALEENILKPGFLTYQEYTEIKLLGGLGTEDSYCYRCGKALTPLTYLDPEFYYQPCWDCLDSKRKSERQNIIDGILRNIREFYYSKILGDRYFQLFIIDPIYFRNTLPHEYSVFKKVIGHLNPPSRNDVWFLDWLPGFPKIISLDNLSGIQLVNLSELYDIDNQDPNKIIIGDYEIDFPELVTYDSKHHSRYSLFNKARSIKTKRLKIGNKCIKFYNTEKPNVKSIFRLLKNGEEINIGSLRKQDFAIIKLAIMRNKTYLRLVFEVVLEILKSCGKFRDTVFLRNSVCMDPKKEKIFNFFWTIKSHEELISDSSINISVI